MTENKPLWKQSSKPNSPYQNADFERLGKEEPSTMLLLKKENKYTNQDASYQYWVNDGKFGWYVTRRAIAPKSEEGPEIEPTHPEAKNLPTEAQQEPIPAKNGSFEYRQYWENRQKYQEQKDKEIKQMHEIKILTEKDNTEAIKAATLIQNETNERIFVLTKVLEKIEGAITSLAYHLEAKKT